MAKIQYPEGWASKVLAGEYINEETLEAVQAESIRATLKHGFVNTNLNPGNPHLNKLANLMEEVGEVAQLFTYDKIDADYHSKLKAELIQVANLALAWAQSESYILGQMEYAETIERP